MVKKTSSKKKKTKAKTPKKTHRVCKGPALGSVLAHRKSWLIGGVECDSEDSQTALARRILRDCLAVDPSDPIEVVKSYKHFVKTKYGSDLKSFIKDFAGESSDVVLSFVQYHNADQSKDPITMDTLFMLPKQREEESRDRISAIAENYKGGRKPYEASYGMPERVVTTMLPDGSLKHEIVAEIADHQVRGFESDRDDSERSGFIIPCYRPNKTDSITFAAYWLQRTGTHLATRGPWAEKNVLEVYLVTPKQSYLAADVLIDFRLAYERAIDAAREAKKVGLPETGMLFARSSALYERWKTLRDAVESYIWDARFSCPGTVTIEQNGRLKAFYQVDHKTWSLRSPVVRKELSETFLEKSKKYDWAQYDKYWVQVERLLEIEYYLEEHPSDEDVREAFEGQLMTFVQQLTMECPWHLYRNKWKGSIGFAQPFKGYIRALEQRGLNDRLDSIDQWVMEQ